MSLNYELLKQIDSKKKKLDAFRPLLSEQVKNLKRLCDVDFTYNSTVIEGNTFSLRETRVVLLDGITIGGKTVSEHLEVINHKEAIDYIERLAHKNINEYTRQDILNIHSIILKNIDNKNAGKYREVPVYVKLKNGLIHRYCDPLKIIDEIDSFFSWLTQRSSEHCVLFAAEAHIKLVTIHPFADGNGRTARLLMNLILFHYGFPPAIIKAKDRVAYLDAIEVWQQQNKKTLFQNMLIEAVNESLDIYLETLEKNIIWE